MNQATHYTISGNNLLDNYKVHYYFDKYTGAGSNTHVSSDGDSQYSGKIFSYEGGAHSSAALDLFTGDLGTGTFSGGINQFYDSIDITNHEDLFSGEFTFLISAQTTSRQDLGESQKGPVSNNNILFSNLGSGEIISVDELGETCTGVRYSGWQIGINAANRVYFEAYNNFDPLITTYMGAEPPYPQNIWGIVYNGGAVKVGLYDISTEAFSFDSIGIDVQNLDTRTPWKIGSGINFDPAAKFSPQLTLNSGLLAGKINNFLYFNTGMEDGVINTVAKSLYSDLYEKEAATSDSATGMTLGSLDALDISGLLASGFECSITGYETGYVQFDEIREITGTLTGAMTYYLFFSSGHHAISGVVKTYRSLWATGDVPPVGFGVVPPTGITGFLTVNHETGIETALIGCSGTGLSGLIFSSSGFLGETVSGFTGVLASAVSGLSGEPTSFSRPNAFSYIGEPLVYDGVIEKYNIGSFGTIDVGELNNLANIGQATLNPGQGFFMKTSENPDSLTFYLNGVGREQGELTLRTDSTSVTFFIDGVEYARTACGTIIRIDTATPFEIEEFFNTYTITSGSCFVSGLEIIEELTFPISNRDILNIYDTGLNTGTVRSRWGVTGLSDYISPPSPNPISGDQWVLFNGQKLVSGINYIDHPTLGFTPSGYITGITGTYFTFPPVEGTTETTGSGLSFGGSPFFPDSNVIFINGVRQDVTTEYVEHSDAKDLISGKETLKNYGDNVFNNYYY
jgi:hypothetical protein